MVLSLTSQTNFQSPNGGYAINVWDVGDSLDFTSSTKVVINGVAIPVTTRMTLVSQISPGFKYRLSDDAITGAAEHNASTLPREYTLRYDFFRSDTMEPVALTDVLAISEVDSAANGTVQEYVKVANNSGFDSVTLHSSTHMNVSPDTQGGYLITSEAVSYSGVASSIMMPFTNQSSVTITYGWKPSSYPDMGIFQRAVAFDLTDPTAVVYPITAVAACFVSGTKIETLRGFVNVEELTLDDEVLTLDQGYQKIKWIGSTTYGLIGRPEMRPILFKPGSCLGNRTELRVSPNHGVLVNSHFVEFLFNRSEVLVPAKFLINDKDVLRDHLSTLVHYLHIETEQHNLVATEDGVWSETILPGSVNDLGYAIYESEEEPCRQKLSRYQGLVLSAML